MAASRQSVKEQLHASTLEKHHRVCVKYNADRLVSQGYEGGTYDMMPIENCANRFEPRPLVEDIHGDWNSGIERSHCSFLDTEDMFKPGQGGPDKPANQLAKFNEAMLFCTRYIGHTTLKIVTIKERNHCGPISARHLEVAVVRRTRFMLDRRTAANPNHNFVTYEQTYFFELASFAEITNRNRVPLPAWWSHMDDLIFRRSDLAVRHAADYMQSRAPTIYDHNRPTWLDPREPDLETILRQIIEPVLPSALGEDNDECYACQHTFGTVNCDPVPLPCKHYICKTCIVKWAATKPVKETTCPLCRRLLFQHAEDVDVCTLGLMGDKTYINDPRFNAWENWERSCADLDRDRADQLDEYIQIPQDRLHEALQLVLRNARTEPRSSTRGHQLPVRAPEINSPVFTTGIITALRNVVGAGSLQSISYVAVTLRTAFLDHFMRAVHANGLEPYISAPDSPILGGRPERFWLRPRLEQFLYVSINRALMIIKERRCSRRKCSHERFWHKHGDRDFWSPQDDPRVVRRRVTPEGSPTSYRSRSRSRSREGKGGMGRNWLGRLFQSSRPTGVRKRMRGVRPYAGT